MRFAIRPSSSLFPRIHWVQMPIAGTTPKPRRRPYPELPVTIAPIASDLMVGEGRGGSLESGAIAQRLFALSQVEVGSHTLTHPFDWSFFADYDRSREVGVITKAESGADTRVINWFNRLLRGDKALISGSADTPRAFMSEPFDLQKEVERAIEVTEQFAPEGKRVRLYQWSGNARPFADAIKQARLSGLRNINGGDSRFDADFPSVAYVAPISRQVGEERQIYAVNSNENTYTNDWTGPFYGYQNLDKTLANTEEPRRLKGFNVYYHVYSAERRASLDAVRAMLDLARRSKLAPITASQYVDIAEGFFSSNIEVVDDDVWSISNRNALDTVRFDDADTLQVDLARSEGVLGSNRHAGSLYVALDAAAPAVKLTIQDLGNSEHASEVNRPVLRDSRWMIKALSWTSACTFSYNTSGFGRPETTWAVKPSSRYSVRVSAAGVELWSGDAHSDGAGILYLDFPGQGPASLKVAVTCVARATAVLP